MEEEVVEYLEVYFSLTQLASDINQVDNLLYQYLCVRWEENDRIITVIF